MIGPETSKLDREEVIEHRTTGVWQGSGIVAAVIRSGDIERVVAASLPSAQELFKAIAAANMAGHSKNTPIKINSNGSVTLTVQAATIIGTGTLAFRGLFVAGKLIYQGVTGDGVIEGSITDAAVGGEIFDLLEPLIFLGF